MTVTHDIPGDRTLRSVLRTQRAKSSWLAMLILTFDCGLYAAAMHSAWTARTFGSAIVSGALAGVCTAMMFVVGHDACHGSLTANRTLNAWAGRIAFLPSVTPFATWELGHNQTHHVYTNLKPLDYVWAPFSLREYQCLPGWRRLLERLYRTAPGVGAYYMVEIWMRRLILPPHRKRTYWLDCATCWAWALALIVMGASAGPRVLIAGVVVPFLSWNWLMGWAIFEHHTHPRVPWFVDQAVWRRARAQSRCTVHVVLPRPFDLLLHNIMQHSAHHLDVTVPLYHLAEAQHVVECADRSAIIRYRWTPLTFIRHLSACKLYDFDRGRWLDFEGRPTSDVE